MADKTSTGTESGPLAKLREVAGRNPITEKLFDAGQDYVNAKAQNLISSAGSKLGETTKKLTEQAEQSSQGGSLAVDGAKKMAEGKSKARTALELGGKGIKDKITGLFKGGTGAKSSGSKKVINILEDIDVGVPVREAYNQWTQFQEFSGFSKGVVSAEPTDETTSNWNFKIFWSNRSMKATTTEQIPDERIVWTSEGAKGTIKGVVTFHPLGENLTKILMIIEYYPAGFFEKTANIWRAQGRRARLDLKHFRRFIMMQGEANDGWRGEIRDSEVVRTHDDVVAEEEKEQETADEEREAELSGDAETSADEPEEEEDVADEPHEDSEYEDEEYKEDGPEELEEEPDEELDEDEYDEPEYEEELEADEEEPGEEEGPRPRRQRVTAAR